MPPDEVVLIHGIRVATVERCLFDEMRRRGSLRTMVVAADMTFAAGLTSIARMRRYRFERRWYRDVRNVDDALSLSCEYAKSGPEVGMRLVWVIDAGWSQPLCNREVHDLDGRFIATPDLIDPQRGVVGEFAGFWHRGIDRHESDIVREADIRDVGLEYVEAVGVTSRTVTGWCAASTRPAIVQWRARCRDDGCWVRPIPRWTNGSAVTVPSSDV